MIVDQVDAELKGIGDAQRRQIRQLSSRADDLISSAESKELIKNGGLSESALVEAGEAQRVSEDR